MGPFLSFVIGVAVGVIGAWWFFARRDAESRAAMEAGWKKKLDHVEAEVRRADLAHDETKERLRLLQQERLAPPAAPVEAPASEPVAEPVAAPLSPPAEAEPAAPRPAEATPDAAAPEAAPPEVAEPVASRPDAGPPSEAERIAQARRRIDAKLAQLPGGSSARQRLLAERAALDPGVPEPGVIEPGVIEPGVIEPDAGDVAAAPAAAPLFQAPAEAPDDLERIRGIGPVLKDRLNKLGITTFAQIAAFTDDDLARLDEVLDFKGRITREGWIEQARAFRDEADRQG